MSATTDFAKIFMTENDIKVARDALTKRLAEIKKGLPKTEEAPDTPVKVSKTKTETPSVPKKGKKTSAKTESDEEPVANGGAGSAEVSSAPVKKTGKKTAAKTESVEKPEVKPEAKTLDAKREIAFGAKDVHTKTLKEGLGLPEKLSDTETKQFGKTKLELKKYLNDLSDEVWSTKSLNDHVQDWLKLKEMTKGEDPVIPKILTLAELMECKDLIEAGMPCVYWHSETGDHVTGPTDSDEGLDEVGDYLVGENTKRVYNDAEECLGYAGIGKFKDLKV